ncbi:MAG: hypothetical protein WBQ17_09820 [Rhizomicrobium sp.]|jgi:hypothetical protein
MNRLARVSIFGLAALSLSACAIFGGPADRALRKTPSFREGYADGCAAANNPSANYREGPSRDESLYSTDQVYRHGWANGYQTCRPTGVAPGDTPYQPMQGATPGSVH